MGFGGITKGARAQVRLEPKRRDEAKPSRKGEWTSSSPIAALLLLAVVILGAVGAARENMALFTMAFFGGLWSPALGLGVRYIRQGRLGLEAPVDASVLVVADAHPNFVRAVEDGRAGAFLPPRNRMSTDRRGRSFTAGGVLTYSLAW